MGDWINSKYVYRYNLGLFYKITFIKFCYNTNSHGIVMLNVKPIVTIIVFSTMVLMCAI